MSSEPKLKKELTIDYALYEKELEKASRYGEYQAKRLCRVILIELSKNRDFNDLCNDLSLYEDNDGLAFAEKVMEILGRKKPVIMFETKA
jgi:hypothetical protein